MHQLLQSGAVACTGPVDLGSDTTERRRKATRITVGLEEQDNWMLNPCFADWFLIPLGESYRPGADFLIPDTIRD